MKVGSDLFHLLHIKIYVLYNSDILFNEQLGFEIKYSFFFYHIDFPIRYKVPQNVILFSVTGTTTFRPV